MKVKKYSKIIKYLLFSYVLLAIYNVTNSKDINKNKLILDIDTAYADTPLVSGGGNGDSSSTDTNGSASTDGTASSGGDTSVDGASTDAPGTGGTANA